MTFIKPGLEVIKGILILLTALKSFFLIQDIIFSSEEKQALHLFESVLTDLTQP